MSIDACKLNASSSLLKKIRSSSTHPSPLLITSPKCDNKKKKEEKTKKRQSLSFSNKLQSVGLSLVASVSIRRTTKELNKCTSSSNSLPTTLHNNNNYRHRHHQQQQRQYKTVVAPPLPEKLKPSISARPFSQFFFPIKEEEEEEEDILIIPIVAAALSKQQQQQQTPAICKNKNKKNSKVNEQNSSSQQQQIPQQIQQKKIQNKQQQQQQRMSCYGDIKLQQQQQQQQDQQQQQKVFKRHSIADLEFISSNNKSSSSRSNSSDDTLLSSTIHSSNSNNSSNNSSRSNSLITLKNSDDEVATYNVMILSPSPPQETTVVIQQQPSDMITFNSSTTNSCSTMMLTNSAAAIKGQLSRSISTTNDRLSSAPGGRVARARTVLGLDSLKVRELRAIHVWKDTISQLSTTEEDNNNIFAEEEQEENEAMTTDASIEDEEETAAKNELDIILSHPALNLQHNHPLEKQRFVRQSIMKQPSPKNIAMMKFILNELIATEKSYNQLLLLIQNRYMYPMIAASQTKDPLVKSSDIPILFNHLPQLISLSDKLLDKLENSKANIGHIFRSIETDLVVFLKYAMHYKDNVKTIKRACSNVLFVKIDQENLARRDTNRLGMSDYFIAPIQRIPRYCLLLKDLQKYTHPTMDNTTSSNYYTELDFALKVLTGLAVAMDHVQDQQQQNNKKVVLPSSPSLANNLNHQASSVIRSSIKTL